ncbi:MAG: fibrobacter succinogenes major paralogous domain-containing protein [Fibrobacteres bacterium]|nr:fibrobacter succinogenes major paralogous domain-containing protein [Fibrobacterota bacterium]
MVTHTSLHTRLLAALGSAALIHAGDIQLDGVIRDIHDNPVPGIVVSLDLVGVSDTTDAQGRWSLESPLAGLQSPTTTKMRWSGQALSLSLKAPAHVEVDVFDVQGARIGGLPPARLDAGNHNLSIPRTGSGIQWLRLSIDGKTQVFPMGIGLKGQTGSSAEAGARGMSGSNGILAYSWQGDTICTQSVDSSHRRGIQQTLRKVHLTSKAYPDPDTQFGSVVAGINLGDGSTTRRFDLQFKLDEKSNPLEIDHGTISGQFYLPVGAETAKYRQRAWIDVLGTGRGRIGISDTLPFAEFADTIRFDTALRMANAVPHGKITGDSIHLANTSHDLGVAMLQPRKLAIVKYEWEVDGAGFKVGGPTKTVKWSWPGRPNHIVRCRVTDIDGNVGIRERTFPLWHLDSMGRLPDRTVLAGEPVVYDVFVADTDGVAMTIWNFGDGTKDTVYGGPFVSVNHAYPVIPSVGSNVSKDYILTATKVDTKGSRDSTSARITVINPLPSFHVANTVGEVGTRLNLHMISLNEGKLAKVEWGVGSSELVAGKADTLIELPKTPTENYPVRVRVTDERGNVSPVDTVRVRVREAVRMTDERDGQQYRIVTIGTQTWMAQNLNYRQTTGAKDTFGICKELDAAHCAKYGRLYDWAQAMGVDSLYNRKIWPGNLVKRQGICPDGWHIPTKDEWAQLAKAAGGTDLGGGKLKATTGWNDDDKSGFGTDDFWFSAYPSTRYVIDGRLVDFGEGAYWWTTSQETNPQYGDYTTDYRTFYMTTQILYSDAEKAGLESLRCLKD